MHTLLVATTNHGKVQEITKILEAHGSSIKILSLHDFPSIEAPDEPFTTFVENAMHKAQYYAQAFHVPTLCDDSGLCIQSLKGWPGLLTKDFILSFSTRDEAFDDLDRKLKGMGNLGAYFHCSLCFYDPAHGKTLTSSYDHHGHLCFPARGDHGFGFDPIFIPEGYEATMAELGEEVKAQISHRARALQALFQKLKDYWNQNNP